MLVEEGLDSKRFNPVFNTGQFLIYVRDPNHPRYGQVGDLSGHDWRESGALFVDFKDGQEAFADDKRQVSYWLK